MKTLILLFISISVLGCAKKDTDKPATSTPSANTTSTNSSTSSGSSAPSTTGNTSGASTGTTPGTTTGTSSGTITPTDSLTYLALGDSYTIGQSVPLPQSFPYQLTAMLNPQLKVSVPAIIATTGWTTYNLINGINSSGLTTKTYDFVTLLIGVNDQFQGIFQDTYKAEFAVMLTTAIRFAKGNKSRVFVLSIPDYSVTPAINWQNQEVLGQIVTEINQFNNINKSLSTQAGVNYLDITDISRQAATDASLIAADELHPTGKMYGLWMQRLAPLVKTQLQK
ncbi:MAG: SGNH/GDSL hydrolase family protein [Bacteroidota bacterium]